LKRKILDGKTILFSENKDHGSPFILKKPAIGNNGGSLIVYIFEAWFGHRTKVTARRNL
jgi:hypothetical protein